MAFKTVCPKCLTDGDLYMTAGKFYATTMPLEKDGFSFGDAGGVSTEDEWVECRACGRGFPLADVAED